MNRYAVLGLATLVGAGTMDCADAATVPRTFFQNGGNACTGALPTYEGALRKRPKAIANEGNSPAFVTCSAVANSTNLAEPHTVFIYLTNRGAATTNITCTLVNGDEFSGSEATPKSVSLPVGDIKLMRWDPANDAPQFTYAAVSVSCALPPGVELNLFGQWINEDIGV